MIKLIATDLDDTLIDGDLNISQANMSALRQAMDSGITVALVTGRMHCSVVPYATQLGFAPKQPIISYNGALISNLEGEKVHQLPLPQKIAGDVVRVCLANGWTVQAYWQDKLFVQELDKYVEAYARRVGVAATPVGDLVAFIQGKELAKLLIVGETDDSLGRTRALKQQFGSRLQITGSRPGYVEVTDPKANKGEALAYLAASMGLESREVMAIGDGGNDVPMIQFAGIGVAVENAHPEAKAAAKWLVVSNEQDGVAAALHRLFAQGDL